MQLLTWDPRLKLRPKLRGNPGNAKHILEGFTRQTLIPLNCLKILLYYNNLTK
jgi:hypothetical protein